MDGWKIKHTIDLDKPSMCDYQKQLYYLMMPWDDNAHIWEITVLRSGEPAELEGTEAKAVFLRKDGVNVECDGTIEGNIVSVVLSRDCYRVPGDLRGAVYLSQNGFTVTLDDRHFDVRPSMDGSGITPSETVYSVAEIVEKLELLTHTTEIAMATLICNGLLTTYVDGHTLYLTRTSIDGDDAYEAAVQNGYTGTREEWNEFVTLVSTNSASITRALEIANSKAAVTKAELSVIPTDWVGNASPYTAVVSCYIATATNNLVVGAGAMTDEQVNEYSRCHIVCVAQGAGTITLKAYVDKPNIALPVNVMGVN